MRSNEGEKMKTESEMIRVKKPTKELLEELKIIERESFDSVISRLLQTKLEEVIEISPETKKELEKRMESVSKGKVISSKELLQRLKEKEVDKENNVRKKV